MAEDGITRDAFYGGRLMLRQPAKGHRSGTDAVLLAAAVPRDFSGLCHDVGAGVGAAGLGVALLCPGARVALIENDPLALTLAGENVAAAGFAGRASVVACDILDRTARQITLPEAADLVVTNPPFYDAERVRSSPDDRRRAAHVMAADATLENWIRACLDRLAPKGTFVLIHAASVLPEIVAGLGKRLGGVTMTSVHAQAGGPARRVLVKGTLGSRAPFVIAPPLVLHRGDGFTEEAERLHRGDAALAW
jgi:tRNA1(Val) A37 N6-methylase TrmN6